MNCPNCGSENIESEFITVIKEKGKVKCQNIYCKDCGYKGDINNLMMDERKFKLIIVLVFLFIVIFSIIFFKDFFTSFKDIFK